MRRLLSFALSSLLLASVFAAWPFARAASAQGDPVAISIANFAFNPDTVTIEVGTEVTWTNVHTAPHTVTSDVGDFDSGTLEPGDSVTFTFNEPGTYTYHCDIHPNMTGTVEVTE